MISNAKRAVSDIVIDNAIQYPLVSEFNPQSKEAHTIFKLPGNIYTPPGTTVYGLVKFGESGKSGASCGATCTVSCCSKVDCASACTCVAKCLSVTYFDDLAPRIRHISVTEGACVRSCCYQHACMPSVDCTYIDHIFIMHRLHSPYSSCTAVSWSRHANTHAHARACSCTSAHTAHMNAHITHIYIRHT